MERDYYAEALVSRRHSNITLWKYTSSSPAGSAANTRAALNAYFETFGEKLPHHKLWRVALIRYTPVNRIATTKHWSYINEPYPNEGGVVSSENG